MNKNTIQNGGNISLTESLRATAKVRQNTLQQMISLKADQWDRLVANITYDACNQRFIIYDTTLALHSISLRDDHPEEHCSPDGWPKATLKDHQIAQLKNELRDCAVKYHAAEQLRSRLGIVLGRYIT